MMNLDREGSIVLIDNNFTDIVFALSVEELID